MQRPGISAGAPGRASGMRSVETIRSGRRDIVGLADLRIGYDAVRAAEVMASGKRVGVATSFSATPVQSICPAGGR